MKRLLPKCVCVLLFHVAFFIDLSGQATQSHLSGKVMDSAKAPVLFATVGLYKTSNATTALKQTLTDTAGQYNLYADTGSYVLKISYAGFNNYMQIVVLKTEATTMDAVFLSPLDNRLQTITVKAYKPLVEQRDDKIIYNAENDPAAKTESATDLLRKAPMITVDGDGAVTLNGQSTFTILLNGRQTAMFARNAKEALKAFPGAVISKIEIILSPSAKYDAEGAGGIINIVTKKKASGYNASLSSGYNTLNKYNESASVNAKWGNWSLSAYVSTGGYTRGLGSFTFSETTPFGNAAFSKRTASGSLNHRSHSAAVSFELAYDVDSLNTVALYGSLDRYRSNDVLAQTIFTASSRLLNGQSTLNETALYNGPENEAGIDIIHKFRNAQGKELSFGFNAQVYNDDDIASSLQKSVVSNRFVANTNLAKSREQTWQLDFVQPVGENQKIEAGAKAILRSAGSVYESLEKQAGFESFLPDPANSDGFTYRQQVYSLYVLSSIHKKKNSLQMGLRTEHTVADADFAGTKKRLHQAYTNLVPNVVFSRRFTPVYTFLAAYNLRLHRPSITSLDPFVNNSDSLSVSFGNPALKPQVLHSLSLQNRFSAGKVFAAANISGSYSDNLIVQYASFNPATGVTSITKANVGKEWQTGIALNLSAPLGEKMDVGVNAQLRYNKITNEQNLLQRRKGFSGSLSANFRYKIAGGFSIGGNGAVSRSPYVLVNSPASQYYYQVSLRQKLLRDKLALSITANNLHDKYFGYKTVTEDSDFRTVSINTNPFRVISVGVTYNFGKLKDDVSKKKGVSHDDREGR